MTSSVRMACLIVLTMTIASPVWASSLRPVEVVHIDFGPVTGSLDVVEGVREPYDPENEMAYNYNKDCRADMFEFSYAVFNGGILVSDNTTENLYRFSSTGELLSIKKTSTLRKIQNSSNIFKLLKYVPELNEAMFQVKDWDCWLGFLNENLDLVRMMKSPIQYYGPHDDKGFVGREYCGGDPYLANMKASLYWYDYDGNKLGEYRENEGVPEGKGRVKRKGNVWLYYDRNEDATVVVTASKREIHIKNKDVRSKIWKANYIQAIEIIDDSGNEKVIIVLMNHPVTSYDHENGEILPKSGELMAIDDKGELISNLSLSIDPAYGFFVGGGKAVEFRDNKLYIAMIELNGYPQIDWVKSICPGPDCVCDRTPKTFRILKWEWEPLKGYKIKPRKVITRKPDPRLQWTIPPYKEQHDEVMKQTPSEIMQKRLDERRELIEKEKAAKAPKATLPVPEKVNTPKEQPESEPISKNRTYLGLLLAILSALTISVLVIRQRRN